MSKYHSRKVIRDGIAFDSQKEYRRFCELKLLKQTGKITELERQVKFVLIPAQYKTYVRISAKTGKRLKDGKKLLEREVSYIADFVYKQNDKLIVEDVKSPATKTPEYIIKRKLMLWVHGISVKEV